MTAPSQEWIWINNTDTASKDTANITRGKEHDQQLADESSVAETGTTVVSDPTVVADPTENTSIRKTMKTPT